MGIFKNIVKSLILAVSIVGIEKFFNGKYLYDYLSGNLVTVLLTLLAINVPTLSIILAKISDIIRDTKVADAFERTKKQMLFSIFEQVALVILAMICLIISSALDEQDKLSVVVLVLMLGIFFYSIFILWDTAKAAFKITELNINK